MKLFVSLLHPSNQAVLAYLSSQRDINTTVALGIEELKSLMTSYEYDILLVDQIECVDQIRDIVKKCQACGSCEQGETMTGFLCGTQDIDEATVISFFEKGFDIVIHYDINPEILVAKLSAFLRRIKGLESATIRIGTTTINLSKHQVFVGKNKVDLTKKEQNLLECLALNKGKVLSKEFLLDYIYGGMDEPEIRIIDAFIWRIRKKLVEAGQNRDYMQTVWGRGYCLNDQDIEK